MSLSLPDWNQTASRFTSRSVKDPTPVSRLMINITGSGVSTPIVYIWDASQAGSGSAPPTQMSYDLTRGGQALVQVLAILGSSGGPTFLYGDSAVNLNSDSVSAAVTLNSLPITEGSQGSISGRWLNADGLEGPTGSVDIYFTPAVGKPAMIVTASEIHGGWFDFPAFQGLTFTYVLRGLNPLFSNFNLGTQSVINGTQSLEIALPSAFDGNGNTRPATNLYFGFFGPGAGGKVACYDPTTTSTVPSLYAAAGGSVQVPWNGNAPSATAAGVVLGGEPVTGNDCSGAQAVPLLNVLPAEQKQIQGDASAMLPVIGPFVVNDSSGNFIDYTATSTSSATLGIKLMPGTVGSGRVTGVGVFVRDLPAAPGNGGGNKDYQIDGNIACNRLTDPTFLSQTFQLFQRTPITSIGAQTISLSGIPSGDFSSGKLQVILCPYSDIRSDYFQLALDSSNNNGGSQQGASTPDLTVTGPLNQAPGACNAYTLNLVQSGASTTSSTATPVSVSFMSNNNSGGELHATSCTDGNAVTSGSLAVTIPANQPSATFYFKSGTSSSDVYSLNATYGPNNWGRSLKIVAAGTMTPGGLSISIPNISSSSSGAFALATGICYPVDVMMTDGANPPHPVAPNFSSYAYALSTNNGDAATFGSYFSDSACSAGNAITALPLSFTATGNIAYQRVYFKAPSVATSATSNGSLLATPASGGPSGTHAVTVDLASSASLSATNSSLSSSWYQPGVCTQLEVGMFTPYGALVSVASQTTVGLSSPQMTFYTQPDCSDAGSTSGSATLYPSTSFNALASNINVKFHAGTSQALLTMTLGSGPAGTLTFNRLPDSFQLATGNTIPNIMLTNYCQPITLTAAYADGVTYTGAASLPLSTSMTGFNSISYYSNATCGTSSAISSTNPLVLSGSNTVTFYMVTNQLFSDSTDTLQVQTNLNSNAGGGLPTGTLALTAQALGMHVVLGATAGTQGSISAGSCYPITINFDNPPPVPVPTTISLSPYNNMPTLRTSTDCQTDSNAATEPYGIPAGTTGAQQPYYVLIDSSMTAGYSPGATLTLTNAAFLSPTAYYSPNMSCSTTSCSAP